MYFDSHAHVDGTQFDKDRDAVIQRAIENNISLIMNPGADLESSVKAIELAATHDFIYAAVGVHPHEASSMDESMLQMIGMLAKKPKVQAIGEIGLDYHYDFSPRDVQQHWFREQLKLARKLQMPVIIHDREAHHDIMEILKEEQAFEYGVLMHCYSGSLEQAREYVKLGAMLSIAGPVTFKNARKLVEVVEGIDLKHLMIETDSPYLTPEPFRGKRNEPTHVRLVCEKIAAIKGLSVEVVAAATKENAIRYFNIR